MVKVKVKVSPCLLLPTLVVCVPASRRPNVAAAPPLPPQYMYPTLRNSLRPFDEMNVGRIVERGEGRGRGGGLCFEGQSVVFVWKRGRTLKCAWGGRNAEPGAGFSWKRGRALKCAAPATFGVSGALGLSLSRSSQHHLGSHIAPVLASPRRFRHAA